MEISAKVMLTGCKAFAHVLSARPPPLVLHVLPAFLQLSPCSWRDVVAAVKLIFYLLPRVPFPTHGRSIRPLVLDDAAVTREQVQKQGALFLGKVFFLLHRRDE